jgi:hypothetical protein
LKYKGCEQKAMLPSELPTIERITTAAPRLPSSLHFFAILQVKLWIYL